MPWFEGYIGTSWWPITIAWISYTDYWERFLAAVSMLMCQTDFLKPGNVADMQALDINLAAWCPSPVYRANQMPSKFWSAVTVSLPARPHGEINLSPIVWSSMTGTLLLLPDDYGLEHTLLHYLECFCLCSDCAVQQILAAALLLREVIWVGCMLAFSLKCHLWGVIFYLAKYSNKKSRSGSSQGSILCSLV